ncbi:MAG: hypothetical protein Kow00124_18550 [Anaerolineae bacterium]
MIDVISLIVGAVVAAALAVLIYTQRERIRSLRMRAKHQVQAARERASRSQEQRYRDSVIEIANRLHVAGHLVPLEEVAVMPSCFTLPAPFNPIESDPDQPDQTAQEEHDNPLNLIPRIPDWPQILAAYHLPGIPLRRLLRGESSIALLGQPGSGRSVALSLMAILLARQVEPGQAGALLDTPRLPILFRLRDVDLSPETWGETIDVLDPLLSAAARLLRTSERSLSMLRGPLAEGGCVLLADGWDELPLAQRRQVITWLAELRRRFPGNLLVVSGPARGYAPLQTELGLTPVFMLPWNDNQITDLAERWALSWPTIGKTPEGPAPMPDQTMMAEAVEGLRGRTALDIVLKVWAVYAGQARSSDPVEWYRSYVVRVSPAPQMTGALERIARAQLETPHQLGIPAGTAAAFVDAARDASLQRINLSSGGFISSLVNESGLLTEYPGGRLGIAHPAVAASLAARALMNSAFQPAILTDSGVLNPLVMPFLAQLADITPYVEFQLNREPDLMLDNLLVCALWAADADPHAPWHGQVFKQIAAILLAAESYPLHRERAAAALVASRDPNVNFIFKQGIRHPNPQVRILSALGMGAMEDETTVGLLAEASKDKDAAVEVAAVLALGAIGTKDALHHMLETFLTSTEMPRRAVAEMLSTNTAGEGHDILREAIEETDPLTRRAAVYGLARVKADWVLELLDRTHRLDNQWLVRAAAGHFIEQIQHDGGPTVPAAPEPQKLPWLALWLHGVNDRPQAGQDGVMQLVRVLAEGDERHRLAAAEALGALATPDAVLPLYNALRDEHPDIRDAACRALSAISLSTGYPFPTVA